MAPSFSCANKGVAEPSQAGPSSAAAAVIRELRPRKRHFWETFPQVRTPHLLLPGNMRVTVSSTTTTLLVISTAHSLLCGR